MRVYRFEQLTFSVDDGRLAGPHEASGQTLRPQAATLLQTLLERPGEVVPRQDLIDAVWGSDAVVDFEAGLAALLRELRQALVAAGASDKLIETVPRRGYRFNGAVMVEADQSPVLRPGRRWIWPAGGGLLLVLLIIAAAALWPGARDPEAPSDARMAILPLESYDAVESVPEHAGLLLADTLLAELLARPVAGLDLIGRTSLRPYLEREDVAPAVARELGVELLIEGTISAAEEGAWRVELRLLAVPSGQILWSDAVKGAAREELSARAVASGLADAFVAAWPDVRQRLIEHHPSG
jgi:DNA-binding winged helix-turn-helix (wHTH) protein/TolB-like protein